MNQYFTRPSLDSKLQPKKMNPPINNTNTQSSKKISYLQMSLNDKLLLKNQNSNNMKINKGQYLNENHFENVEIPSSYKTSNKNGNSDGVNSNKISAN